MEEFRGIRGDCGYCTPTEPQGSFLDWCELDIPHVRPLRPLPVKQIHMQRDLLVLDPDIGDQRPEDFIESMSYIPSLQEIQIDASGLTVLWGW